MLSSLLRCQPAKNEALASRVQRRILGSRFRVRKIWQMTVRPPVIACLPFLCGIKASLMWFQCILLREGNKTRCIVTLVTCACLQNFLCTIALLTSCIVISILHTSGSIERTIIADIRFNARLLGPPDLHWCDRAGPSGECGRGWLTHFNAEQKRELLCCDTKPFYLCCIVGEYKEVPVLRNQVWLYDHMCLERSQKGVRRPLLHQIFT